MRRLRDLRVLVVDDNADTREMISLFLGAEGARVTVAEHAGEALEALEADRVDVIVCDIGLPGVDGLTLLRSIRALPPERGGSTPALALTGYSEQEMRERVVAAGYQKHVVKPVEPSRLVDLIACVAAGGSPGTTSEP